MYLPWTPHRKSGYPKHFYLLPLPWPSFIPPWMEVARIPQSQWTPFALMESSSLPQKPRTTWNDALPAARSDGNYECLPGFAYVNRLGDLVDPFWTELGYIHEYTSSMSRDKWRPLGFHDLQNPPYGKLIWKKYATFCVAAPLLTFGSLLISLLHNNHGLDLSRSCKSASWESSCNLEFGWIGCCSPTEIRKFQWVSLSKGQNGPFNWVPRGAMEARRVWWFLFKWLYIYPETVGDIYIYK